MAPKGIYTYMDCSMVHITKNDADLLQAAADGLEIFEGFRCMAPLVYPFPAEYGFMVHVIDDDELLALHHKAGFSAAFMALLTYARKYQCWWLRLDPDGEVFDEFPSFEEEWD